MANAENERPIIVIKKIKKGGHGHHGGAWKIAYADFVTAMMAFFLLMWLLGSTSEGELKGISDYFNTPLKVALMGGDGTGMSNSVINGGGKDLSRTTGQIKAGSAETGEQSNSSGFAAEQAEAQKLQELKQNIEALIDGSELMKQFENQILLDITTEGLRIQIVDEQNRPMFDTGSAVLKPHMKSILKNLTSTLNQVPNKLTLSGHTDATSYASGYKGYSNWELSADRANACRREMVASGLGDGKILRVVGLSSSIPFNEVDAYAAVNRRISIVVMNKKTEDAVRNLSKNKTNDEKLVVDLPPIPKIGTVAPEPQSQSTN